MGMVSLGNTPPVRGTFRKLVPVEQDDPQRGLGEGQGRGGYQPGDAGSDHDSFV
jgi:hypothetical protein